MAWKHRRQSTPYTRAQIAVVMFSGTPSVDHVHESIEAGGYVVKPFTAGTVADTLSCARPSVDGSSSGVT